MDSAKSARTTSAKPDTQAAWKAWSQKSIRKKKQAKWRARAQEKATLNYRHGKVGRRWHWNIMNYFQPPEKWTARGRLLRPAPADLIAGCVYYAMKRIKRGTDQSVHVAALEDGLATLTKRPTYLIVQIELRVLHRLGVITRVHSSTPKKKQVTK